MIASVAVAVNGEPDDPSSQLVDDQHLHEEQRDDREGAPTSASTNPSIRKGTRIRQFVAPTSRIDPDLLAAREHPHAERVGNEDGRADQHDHAMNRTPLRSTRCDRREPVQDVAEVQDLEDAGLRTGDVVRRRIGRHDSAAVIWAYCSVGQRHAERGGIDIARDVLRDRRVALEELFARAHASSLFSYSTDATAGSCCSSDWMRVTVSVFDGVTQVDGDLDVPGHGLIARLICAR